jgi:hypothetical protein
LRRQGGRHGHQQQTADKVTCGPDVDAQVAALRPAVEAALDEVYVANVGPHYAAMIKAYGAQSSRGSRTRWVGPSVKQAGRGYWAVRRKESIVPKKKPGPGVKDPELYEELREDGASKEKAARIANEAAASSRSEVGRRGGESGSYDDWTLEELQDRAAEIGIEGRSSMNKGELIDALRNH